MLVFDVNVHGSVIVNHGELTVKLLEICGDYIRLGFDADKSIPIDRGSIYKKKYSFFFKFIIFIQFL